MKVVDGVRLHIFGGSGTGTSTLARGLATRLASQCFDTDDFYWVPGDPAFEAARPVAARLALMQEVFLPRSDWILSGSLLRWGEPVVARMTHAIFLTMDAEARMARLLAREVQRYGTVFTDENVMFMRWAEGYDDPAFCGRSLTGHRDWIAGLPVPVIELDGGLARDELVEAAVAALERNLEFERRE
ncbi:MAG: adenylate kinase [Paracoccaceae bacterium]